MKKANNNIFIDMYPSVDMHGLDRESARVLTDDFVKENIKLGNKKIIIIMLILFFILISLYV